VAINGRWARAIIVLFLSGQELGQHLRVVPVRTNGRAHRGLNLKWPNQSLTSVGAKTYVVWVDSKNVVKVSCLDRATDPITEQAVTLDDAYTGPRNDGHHGFAIGISSDGYIHISGHRHHHPRHDTDDLSPVE
jgi:hypothetical protein